MSDMKGLASLQVLKGKHYTRFEDEEEERKSFVKAMQYFLKWDELLECTEDQSFGEADRLQVESVSRMQKY